MTHSFKQFAGMACLLVSLAVACKKQPPVTRLPDSGKDAAMQYFDFGNAEVKPFQSAPSFDLNGDGSKDLVFGVQLVGDPIHKQDKYQFRVSSLTNNRLPVLQNQETPVLAFGETISAAGVKGGTWYAASSVVLMQKVINDNGPINWYGNWMGAVRKYLAIQVYHNNQWFNGWVALTVDAVGEKLILHNAALSKAGEMDIKAGM